jgi:uncharacterized membrane protein
LPEGAARALGMGAVAGLRSMAAPAALSRAARRGDVNGLQDTPLALLGSSKVSKLLTLFEAGELMGDKLPTTQSRTLPSPLIGRAFSGAVVGAALFVSEGRRAAAGGAFGAAGAVAGAYAGERLRARLGQLTGAPDPVVALFEDAVAVFGAHRLLR